MKALFFTIKASVGYHVLLGMVLSVCFFCAPAVSAPPAFISGELLVKITAGPASIAAANIHRAVGATVIRDFPRFGWQHVKLPPGMTVEEGIARYKQHPGVAHVEPNYLYRACATPGDPMYSQLWGMVKINAPIAWDTSTGSADIVVADIDSGIDYTHPDLAANMWTNSGETPGNGIDDDGNGYVDDVYGIDTYNGDTDPQDDYGHGTHIAGTIGAVGNNAIGVAGINWSVKIMALKFMDASGNGTTADAVECFQYLLAMKTRGVNIRATNNSWGGGGYAQALIDAINAAGTAGIVNVCSAGNNNTNNDVTSYYPASYTYCASIISVAASDQNDNRATFSNWGDTTVSLAAPGVDIVSTLPGNNYGAMSGTSMAAPHVAGAVALLYAVDPGQTVAQVKDRLLNSTDPVVWSVHATITSGRLNLAKAIGNTFIYTSATSVVVPEGGTATFGVKLSRNPGGDVAVSVANGSGDPDITATGGASLLFNSTNWNTFQTVTLTAASDADSLAGTALIQCSAEGWQSATKTAVEYDTTSAPPSGRGNWWMLQHDPQHTGRSPLPGPGSPTRKWAYATGGGIQSSPALAADGTVYVGSADKKLHAVNPDGTQKWAFTAQGVIISSPAIGADGTIYVGSAENAGTARLYALNPNGTVKWDFYAGQILTSPTIGENGTIFLSATKLYALNPDGSKQWTFASSGYGFVSSPALGADGTIYIGSVNGNLYAFNSDGTQKWASCIGNAGSAYFTSPTVGADGTIYIALSQGRLFAVNPNGTTKWQYSAGGAASSPILGSDGTIYIGSTDGKLYAIHPNGTLKWTAGLGGILSSTPAIGADGTMYAGSTDGKLYAINPDGSQRWNLVVHNPIKSSPAIGEDGILYVGADDGQLYAIGGTPRPLLTLSKSVVPDCAQLGEKVTYTLIYMNDGNEAATNTILTDVLPDNLTYVVGSATGGGEYAADTRTLTWRLGTVNAGDGPQSVTFQAIVDSGADYGANIINVASIACDGQLPVTSNSTTFTVADAGTWRGDWWMFHHDPQHTGRSRTVGPDAPTVKWTYATGAMIRSAPVVGPDNTIYFCASDGYLYAMNSDGTRKWRFYVGCTNQPGQNCPAVGPDNTIYTLGGNTTFYAVNGNGTEKWRYHWPAVAMRGAQLQLSSPVIGNDGVIYLGTLEGNLLALTPQGTVAWEYTSIGTVPGTTTPSPSMIISSPALGTDGTLYIGWGSYTRTLSAVDSSTGILRWTYDAGTDIRSSPAIDNDGNIYFNANGLNAVDSQGNPKWTFSPGNNLVSSPAIGPDGTIFIGGANSRIYAVNADGTQKWVFTTGAHIGTSPLGDMITSSPLVDANGSVYIGSIDGSMYAIARDGTQKWKVTTGGEVHSSPAMDKNGTLYIGSLDGKLYAIEGSGTPLPFFTLRKSVTPANTHRGGTLTYTLVYRNCGAAPATNVLLTDVLPAHVSYVPDSATGGGVYDSALHTLTWTLGAIDAQTDPQVVTFQATVNADVPMGTVISNTGSISCAELAAPVVSNAAAATVVNQPPVAGNDAAIAPTSTPTTIVVLANDTDPDGDTLVISTVGTPQHGQAIRTADNRITYTSDAGYTGADTFTYIADDGQGGIAQATVMVMVHTPLTDAVFTATPPAPQLVNTVITLAVTPAGGYNPQFLFREGYLEDGAWHWRILRYYSVTRTCNWRPTTARTYTLQAWVRETGATVSYQFYKTMTCKVMPPVSSVTLTASPVSPRPINTAITLTATPTGGANLEYQFRVGYQQSGAWTWTVLRAYAPTRTCTWRPDIARAYNLQVWAREQGSRVGYQVIGMLGYTITPRLTAVTLAAQPPAPQFPNTAITLTATPVGGANVQYQFRAGYRENGVWTWKILRGYGSYRCITWTPTVARTYTIVVWARETGSTQPYEATALMGYQVK